MKGCYKATVTNKQGQTEEIPFRAKSMIEATQKAKHHPSTAKVESVVEITYEAYDALHKARKPPAPEPAPERPTHRIGTAVSGERPFATLRYPEKKEKMA